MKTVKLNDRLTSEERETHLNYDAIDKQWIMESFIPKHFRKALKKGWTPIKEYVYEDGMVCGMILSAPERAITIRSTDKKELTDKQLNNLGISEEQ